MNRWTLAALALLGGLGLLLRKRFVAVTVEGESMLPSLRSGDRVLVRRVSLHRVRRGQVVVLAPPPDLPAMDNPPWLIKRAAALPGDPVPPGVPGAGSLVPPGQLVVLGDNVPRSYDSRRAGLFDGGALLGIVVRRMD